MTTETSMTDPPIHNDADASPASDEAQPKAEAPTAEDPEPDRPAGEPIAGGDGTAALVTTATKAREAFQAGYSIPERSNIRLEKTHRPIRHFWFTLRPGVANPVNPKETGGRPGSLVLKKRELTPAPIPMADTVQAMSDYALRMLSQSPNPAGHKETGIDIDVKEQCWLLLELDSGVNWRFATGHPAVTTKMMDEYLVGDDNIKRYGFNTSLRYVYDDKVVYYEEVQHEDICRLVFFQVLYRAKKKRRGMNLAIELFDVIPGAVETRTIPLIIDPDVPDDGHEGFPDPP